MNEMCGTFQHPCQQYFSLPYPLLKYFLENPTPVAWKKLIQTCKYFFAKNFVYPVECMRTVAISKIWYADKETFNLNKTHPNFWLYNKFYAVISSTLSTIPLLPKIMKCNLQILQSSHHLKWKDYQILTSSGTLKALYLHSCHIKYSNGTIVTLDKIIESLHNLERLDITCLPSLFEPETVKKIVEIFSSLNKLKYFILQSLTGSFNFSDITDFLMKNDKISFRFIYPHYLPLFDGYKRILEDFIDKIIANPPIKIPRIEYPGNGNQKYIEMYYNHN